MNSADSLSYESDGRDQCSPKTFSTVRQVDTSLQGADIQDSPRGGSVTSSASSLSPVRVDTSTPQTIPVSSAQFTTGCAATIAGHQLLVDPITGQHYLIPSGPQPHPQLIYQPVYYAAAPAQPVFYPPFAPSTQGALLMPSLPPGQHGVGQYVHPSTLSQRLSMTPSVVSSKPSSVGSSSPSTVDSINARFKPIAEERSYHRLNADSEVRSPPSSPCREKPIQFLRSVKALQQQSSMPSNRECRRPSPLTCAPASSDVSEQPELKEQRTPLYGGSPAWWGDDKQELRGAAEHSFTDAEPTMRSRRTSAVVSKTIVSDTEPTTSRSIQLQKELAAAAAQTKKAIRMDIDLSKPFEDVEKAKDEKAKVVMRAPPTSFTVTFDNEDDRKMSLQDAAKRSNTRRFLRRSAPAATGSMRSPIETNSKKIFADTADPKQYLLKKMLMGDAASPEDFAGGPEFAPSVGGPEKRDVDVISEAGTYVVDEKDRLLDPMASSQCLDDSDSDSDTSESTATTSSATDQTPPSYAPVHCAESTSTGPSGVTPTSNEKRADLLRGLLQFNAARQEPQKNGNVNGRKSFATAEKRIVSTCAATATVSRVCTANAPVGRGTRFSGLHAVNEESPSNKPKRNEQNSAPTTRRCWTASSNSSGDNLTRTRSARTDSPAVKNDAGQIRRVDGGRFSMRTASGGRGANQVNNVTQQAPRNGKPPFRGGNNGNVFNCPKAANAHKESAEMTAWLRRKDYNPMKAAAEARKLQQLKTRSDQFTSNRSISFHQGTAPIPKSMLSANLARSRYNKSQDDLCEENPCGSTAVLATYSKGVTENLRRLKQAEKNADSSMEAIGVQKAVEQLALKCYRSIDLIRNTHQGQLPDSVENLLDRVTEPALKTEGSVAEQVTRLSAAFDAIQKYLEVSSGASPSASSANSGRASPSHQSASSTKET